MGDKNAAGKGEACRVPPEDPGAERPLLRRKAVLIGMLTSGLVVANGLPSSANAAGTVKPIAAAQPAYAPRWAPSVSYVPGQQVISPNNDVVSANVGHTSSAAFTIDGPKWALSSTYALSGSTYGLLPFSRPGTLTVAGGSARLPLPTAATLVGVTASLGTPADADVIVDVNRNGATVFAHPSARPRVVAGQHSSAEYPLNIVVAPGDYLTVDVDTCGGASPGADLTVIVRYAA